MAMLTSSCFLADRVESESKDRPDHCVYRTSGITLIPTSSINLKPSPHSSKKVSLCGRRGCPIRSRCSVRIRHRVRGRDKSRIPEFRASQQIQLREKAVVDRQAATAEHDWGVEIRRFGVFCKRDELEIGGQVGRSVRARVDLGRLVVLHAVIEQLHADTDPAGQREFEARPNPDSGLSGSSHEIIRQRRRARDRLEVILIVHGVLRKSPHTKSNRDVPEFW